MFRVYEVFNDDLTKASNEFNMPLSLYSRGFVLDEDGLIGFVLLTLQNGKVKLNKPIMRLKETSSETEARFYDLLLRAVLNILIDMKEITVFTDFIDNNLLKFGFKIVNEQMQITAKNITLSCH